MFTRIALCLALITTTLALVAQSNNVGIGTTAPSEILEIVTPDATDTVGVIKLRAPNMLNDARTGLLFGKNDLTGHQGGIWYVHHTDSSLFRMEFSLAGQTPLLTMNGLGQVSMPNDVFIHGLRTGRGAGTGNNPNTAFGLHALWQNTSGTENTAIGANVLEDNSVGSQNTGVGLGALAQNTIGNFNTGIGYTALGEVTTGAANTAIGSGALTDMFTGSRNVAIGAGALNGLDGGNNNVGIGYHSGFENTGSGNIFIGHEAGFFETGSDKLYIDNTSTSSPLIHGDFDSDQVTIHGSLRVTNLQNDDTQNSLLIIDDNGLVGYRDAASITGSGGGHWQVSGSNIFSTNTGNVGIGTPSPGRKLHVEGNTYISNNLELSNELDIEPDGNTVFEFVRSCMGSGGDFMLVDFWGCPNEFDFIDFRRGPAQKFRVTQGGNVYADGTILCREIEVSMAAFPDYVFESGYELLSLKEIDEFIREHGHLPNIPSAGEVEANGIGLGEMSKKLLEKVEELTLHLIEKEKEVNALHKELSDQQAKTDERLSALEALLGDSQNSGTNE